MITLKNLVSTVMRFLIGTRAFTSGAIAIGTTKSKIKTAAAINYCINGVMYLKAATDDLFVFTDTESQADGSTRYYLLCLNAAGEALVVNGTASALPACPSGYCPVGYVKIATAGAAFVPGTTLLDAGTVTDTYVNLSTMPLAVA